MGEVWRGVHSELELPVAIKVITSKRARKPRYHEAFRQEVRAVARLDHPGVVLVFDYGQVPQEAEEASRGRLSAGSPYLVMELASGGSLRSKYRRMRWFELRDVVFRLLDALAHAHARGVVHRDIKPSNILISTGDDLQPGLKLADFGLAHALDQADGGAFGERGQGTPYYMAPEQCWGHWRDYGPWTDLYAMGCLVYELVTGHPPFLGESFSELALQHQNVPPPQLRGLDGFPDGFEEWLLTLVEKEPALRYQCAADAAWGLLKLGNPKGGDPDTLTLIHEGEKDEVDRRLSLQIAGLSTLMAEMADSQALEAGRTETGMPPEVGSRTETDSGVGLFDRIVSWSPSKVGAQLDAPPTLGSDTMARPRRLLPPMPADWRYDMPRAATRSTRITGVGLGLYGLRTIPLVDREAERDQIWTALRNVRNSGVAHALLVHGAAGNGKSRLVEWLCERARELGCARVLKVTCDASGTGDGPLARLVTDFLRCARLPRTRVMERVRRWLTMSPMGDDEGEARAIVELICGAEPHPDGRVVDVAAPVRARAAAERYATVARLIARVASERPVIVWIDDVQWGVDGVEFTRYLLDSQALSPQPVLVLLTARDDALAQEPRTQARVSELMSEAGARPVHVGPLDASAHATLVGELLGLQGELAARVVSRTGGNPLFAVQLVGDWVQRGVLEMGRSGFVLKDGEPGTLPDDIHAVWAASLSQLLADLGDGARTALELAAVLGLDVSNDDWKAVCEQADVGVPAELVERMSKARLAYGHPAGWTFGHGMLRDGVVRLAREAGRFEEHNRICAAHFWPEYEAGAVGAAERVGRHLASAGQLYRAVKPLLVGARERSGESAYHTAHDLLELREWALTELKATSRDPAWAEGWALRAWVYRAEGRLEEAVQLGEKAEVAAGQSGAVRARAEALKTLGSVGVVGGDLTVAGERTREALKLYQRLKAPAGVASCLFELGWLCIYSNAFDEARDALLEAYNRFEKLGDRLSAADALRSLGQCGIERGDLDVGDDCTQRALSRYEAAFDRRGMATCLRQLAIIAKRRGELEESGTLYRRAERFFDQNGNPYGVAACVSGQAEVLRMSGDLDGAESGFRRALHLHSVVGTKAGAWYLYLNLGLTLLSGNRRHEARDALQVARDVLEKTGRLGPLGSVHVQLCACATGDWEEWEHHLSEARRLLAEAGTFDPDTAWSAQLAGDLARAANQPERARRVYQLAYDQWTAVGDAERAEEVALTVRLIELRAGRAQKKEDPES